MKLGRLRINTGTYETGEKTLYMVIIMLLRKKLLYR